MLLSSPSIYFLLDKKIPSYRLGRGQKKLDFLWDMSPIRGGGLRTGSKEIFIFVPYLGDLGLNWGKSLGDMFPKKSSIFY